MNLASLVVVGYVVVFGELSILRQEFVVHLMKNIK